MQNAATAMMLAGFTMISQASAAQSPTPPIIAEHVRPLSDDQRPPTGGCLNLTRNARVVALGAYEGKEPVSFYAPNDAHEAGAIAVSGEKKGPPVVLVLSAYDPVVWDLRRVPNGRLEGVVLYGYSAQAVVGLAKGVPLRFSTRTRADPRCGAGGFAYQGGTGLERLSATVTKAVGRPIDVFYGSYAPRGFNIDGGAEPLPDTGTITLNMLVGSETFEVSAVPPGAAGIAMLLQQGAIRLVMEGDQEELNAALTKASPTGHLAPVRMRLDRRSYVILKPITMPRGMYGGHSGSFLIAKGVPSPNDPGSHNTYIRLDDGSCLRGSPLRGTRCTFGGD